MLLSVDGGLSILKYHIMKAFFSPFEKISLFGWSMNWTKTTIVGHDLPQ
jgi:hypothetical protein